MKPKGINPFELHVEKIVMGVALLIVGALAARQFLTNPNAVELAGSAEKLAPADVDDFIYQKSEDLRRRMDQSALLDVDSMESLSVWFENEHQSSVGGDVRASLNLVHAAPLKVGRDEGAGSDAQLYTEFAPPIPGGMKVYNRNYSLDPEIVTETAGLEEYFGDEPPYDLSAIHVRSVVNGTLVRDALHMEQDDCRMIPSVWWSNDMMILDVVLDRQERLEDGSWSELIAVSAIPGQDWIRDEIESLQSNELSQLLSDIAQTGEEVYEVPFYRLSDGADWSIDSLKAEDPLTEEQKEYETAWKRAQYARDKTKRQLDRFLQNQVGGRGQNTRDEGKGGGGYEGGTGFGVAGGGESGSSEDVKKDRLKSREEKLDEDYQNAEEELKWAREDLLAVKPDYQFPDEEPKEKTQREPRGKGGGGTEYLMPGEGDGMRLGGESVKGTSTESETGRYGGKSGRRQLGRDTTPLLDNEELEVWTHDISVTPGTTYRYRLRVMYYNPFYGRQARLDHSQRHLADSVVVASEPMEWSEPIRVSPPQQFFAVDGNYGDFLEDRRASFEIYLFTGGEYRMAHMSAKPGEPIADQKMVVQEDVSNSTEEDEPLPGDGRRPRRDEETGPKRVPIDFFTGAVFLDVLPVLDATGQMGNEMEVVVALEDGTLMTVNPSEQKDDSQRTRLHESVANSSKK